MGRGDDDEAEDELAADERGSARIKSKSIKTVILRRLSLVNERRIEA